MAGQYPLTLAQAKKLCEQKHGRLPLPGYEMLVTQYPVNVKLEGSWSGPKDMPLLRTYHPPRTVVHQAKLWLQNNAGYYELREHVSPS